MAQQFNEQFKPSLQYLFQKKTEKVVKSGYES